MIRYPQGLPRPQADDYEFTQTNNIMRTAMESGRAVQRTMWAYDELPSQLTMSFVFNQVQARLFDAWACQLAKAEWFIMPVYSWLGYDIDEVCRFIETPSKQTPVGVTHWRYSSCKIEIRKKPEMPEDWALLPSFILNSEIFDIAINIEKP